jgi:hypothetical protein
MTRDNRATWWYALIAIAVLFAAWYFLRDTPAEIPDWVTNLWH